MKKYTETEHTETALMLPLSRHIRAVSHVRKQLFDAGYRLLVAGCQLLAPFILIAGIGLASAQDFDDEFEFIDDPAFGNGFTDMTPTPSSFPTELTFDSEDPSGNDGDFVFIPITYDETPESVDTPVSDDEFEFVNDPAFEDEFEFVDDPSFDSEFEFVDDPSFGDRPAGDDSSSGGQAVTEEEALADPDLLLQVADELFFPRVGPSETFWQTQGYLNEVLEGDIIYQHFVREGMGSEVLMSMFPAEISVRAGKLRPSITQAWERDYHTAITVIRREAVPNGAGGCWLRFSNVRTKGEGGESGLILFPEREAQRFEPVGNHQDLVFTPVADLSDLNLDSAVRFDFIRLDGVSFVYANGKFLFRFEDGFDGKMSFEGGAEIYAGGNRVRCDFDNFTMRYR